MSDEPPGWQHRSPFVVAFQAALGVAVAYLVVVSVEAARQVLVLIGLALFLAIGLDPMVTALIRRGVRRKWAVLVVIVIALAVLGGFLAAAVPPLVTQASDFAKQVPHYVDQIKHHQGTLGHLDERYHFVQRISDAFQGKGVASGVIGAGKVVLNAVTGTIIVIVLTIYFLVDLARVRGLFLHLVPRSRRERVESITEEALHKVGSYVLGNIITSGIAGVGTFVWLFALGVPYPLLLAIFVALIDLVPVIGSTIGGIVVSLVALTVSLPVALGTLGFYVLYRFLEDYLIVPRIMGRAVDVPATVTVVAVLIGGALLGIIGALVAIPAAAMVRLLLQEIVYPRQEAG